MPRLRAAHEDRVEYTREQKEALNVGRANVREMNKQTAEKARTRGEWRMQVAADAREGGEAE